jgi:hypothetical protein
MMLLRSAENGTVSVFRGPMSAMACFYTSYRGVMLFFSSLEDCVHLNVCSFSINWDCVRAQAVGGIIYRMRPRSAKSPPS